MKLVASMTVHNEMHRYLPEVIVSLLGFCDEIRVIDDSSTDGTAEWLERHDRISVRRRSRGPVTHGTFDHEGNTRQDLLAWTLAADPTHVLVVDADEFVGDGTRIREAIQASPRTEMFALDMLEVWELDGDCLCVREDGGWRPHPVPILWRVPDRPDRLLMKNAALASGRVPQGIRSANASVIGTILHFGWTNPTERQARYSRYAEADGGRFHANTHIESIMWTDGRVRLDGYQWPEWLSPYRISIERLVRP